MSNAPNKRLHDESAISSGTHTSASKYSHDDPGAYSSVGPKIMPSSANEYHPSFDMGQEARMPKITRTDSRDLDRRPPLLSMYRMPSTASESHPDHPVSFENKMESRDFKDSNRDPKAENREPKPDPRDLSQNARGDKDVKYENRADDNKETKYERDTFPEYRSETKLEKDGYGLGNNHLSWKESKDHHRGKRYPDVAGYLEPWFTSRSSVHPSTEVRKENTTSEGRDFIETHEAVGENKVDMKVDDKLKEAADKKRKEGKHREWGDRDKDRNDPRNTVQLGSGGNEAKDSTREEREAERWERDKKDISKEKYKPKDKEKDHTKRDTWNGAEKEGSKDKEPIDTSARTVDQENSTQDQKKPKDKDIWKNADRDPKERKKEREADLEGERADKRSRYYDKESDDGTMDVEGGVEREVFSYGVQPRKRMLRPRGSPQVANREPRFRSRIQDNEGSQGKPDLSTVVYRVGECMQEITKLWKEYELSQVEKSGETAHNGPTLEIRIPAENVTATNRQVRGGQLWGTDIYTDDSDLVAVLMHIGYCRPTASSPPPAIQELRATIRVLPPQDCYISTLRNNVRSRAWGAAIGCSYRVEHCCIVKKGGGTIDLEPCLTHTSTVEPTLAPVTAERTMTTRAAASNALRQQRFVREVTIQYNLCNEPWLKYSISVVADKGLKKPLYTSARLKKGEVLFLETHSCRYELCFNGEKVVKTTAASQTHESETERCQNLTSHSTNGEKNTIDGDNVVMDVFRWSRCKKFLPQKVMRSIGIPLPLEYVEVLEENLDWEDIQWSQTGVWITGKEYPLARVHFLSPV